jgi:phage terminase small subunit
MAKKGSTLAPKQLRFVEEYLVDLNATKAAERAGYSKRSAYNVAYRMLQDPRIGEAIAAAEEARAERTQITADRVLRELAMIGFSDMRRFAKWGPKGITLIASEQLDPDAARCVAEVSEIESKDGGSLKFKLHNKVDALTLLGKHLGLFSERMEHTGKDGKPIQHEHTVRQTWKVGDRMIAWN